LISVDWVIFVKIKNILPWNKLYWRLTRARQSVMNSNGTLWRRDEIQVSLITWCFAGTSCTTKWSSLSKKLPSSQ
jgi:hypothetical protein